MPTVEFQRGDTISQLALKHGFRHWDPIWQHGENSALRELRKYPDVLAPGDKIFVPEMEPEEYRCETNRRHSFRVKGMTQRIQQKILDGDGVPLTGKRYELKAGEKVATGKTNGEGMLTEEIPIDAKTGELKIWIVDGDDASALTWSMDFGRLEPVDTIFGLKGRLKNLGYDCGEVSDELDEKTRMALAAFQRDHDLPSTGENDEATQQKLFDIHEADLED